mgnify:CR=1 FL=1
MESFFKEKEGKVIVIDSSGAARTLLGEVVRSLGFGDVNGVSGIKEAIEMMEVERVNWIITPILADQNENAIRLLELCINEAALRHVRVSFLLEETELEILPDGVSRGMLSYHSKPFTKASLTDELTQFLTDFESFDWNGALLAANYFRGYMMEASRTQELLTFEKKLLDYFPGRIDQIFNTIPPLANLGRKEEAISILKQIKLIDSSQEEKIEKYLGDYLDGASLDGEGGDTANFLGVNKVLIVDSDEIVAKEVQSILGDLGIENVIISEDGESAIKELEENEDIDLVIQEWRIPKLTGPLFLQKALEKIKNPIPFVLLSSLVEDQDQHFVKEMGVAAIIPKPLNKEEFIKSIIWTVQQDRLPTEQSSMERKIRQFLDEKNISEAQSIKERYLADTSIQQGHKMLIEAEFYYIQKEYEKSRDFGIEAIKHVGDSIFVLNLLGKIMMNLREFDIALKCFEKAQAFAPMNLERLCQIAEVHSEMENTEKAAEAIEAAVDLDPDSEKVQETTAKLAINSGDVSGAKKIMEQLKAMENVVSYMNNQAVALARCDMFKEGIQQYNTTLQAIPESRKDVFGIVSFNLALAHLRAANAKESIPHLEQAIQNDSVVQEKAKKLLARVKNAVEKGKPLQVQKSEVPAIDPIDAEKGDESDASMDGSSSSAVLSIVQNNPGDINCYLIFQNISPLDSIEKMISGKIRFNPRDSITRGEVAVNEAS